MGMHSAVGNDENLKDDVRHRIRAAMLWTSWTCLWLAPTVIFLLMAVSEWAGWDPARDYEAAAGGVMIATITGALTALGVARLCFLHKAPLRFEPPRARADRPRELPRLSSSTRRPMYRLAKAEATISDLLDQVDDKHLRPGCADDIRHVVAAASHDLWAIAAKIQAIERTLDPTRRPWEREPLAAGVRELLDQLDRGLDRYDAFILAAGQAVVASAATPSMADLTDATDHLTGLSYALRELADNSGRLT